MIFKKVKDHKKYPYKINENMIVHFVLAVYLLTKIRFIIDRGCLNAVKFETHSVYYIVIFNYKIIILSLYKDDNK
jgi:hypothetical protein